MQFKQVLLVFSALIALTNSFPTGAEQNETDILAQNISHVSDALEDKRPLTVVVEDRNPKSESVVVEFVYNSNGGNPVLETKASDKDKYSVDLSLQTQKTDKSKNINVKTKEKSEQEQNTEKKPQEKVNQPDSDHKLKEFRAKAVTSLMSEEVSPLSGKWPKFYYEVFNPIQPFPELHYDKQNQIHAPKVQSETSEVYLPYAEKERKEPISVAGPRLSPLSLYEREFNVPIFD